MVLQVDLEQSSDRLKHSAILEALCRKKALKALAKSTYQCRYGLRCRVRLGNTVSDCVEQDHGVPQGAPESPSMFVHTTDTIMCDIVAHWEASEESLSSRPY